MPPLEPRTLDLLRLTLTPGLGPVLIARLLAAFGSPERVIRAEPGSLRGVRGIGPERAAAVCKGLREMPARMEAELKEIEKHGVNLLARGSDGYPPLLDECEDAPPLLYVRGAIDAVGEKAMDRFPLAMVGSRKCTLYGTEQAERFAMALGSAGITIVSGGARGIDTAAHRAAMRGGGRTIAVLGCGLSMCYPPDNAELFEQIVTSGRGAVVSELPMATAPSAENFPARNRIIAGLSLGVLVIEAARGSGALITATQATEMGREVFAMPGRVDSPASEGSLELLKAGGAALVTEPADVLNELESPARHLHGGTHEARYGGVARGGLFDSGADSERTEKAPEGEGKGGVRKAVLASLSDSQRAIVEALESGPMSLDELGRALTAEPGVLRGDVTMLEIRRVVKREGARIARV